MNLVDLFEYLQICWDHDRKVGIDRDQSVVWTLFCYLGLADIINLRQLCRSSSRLVTLDIQRKAVSCGNLEQNIRANFWVGQAPFFDLQNELKRQLSIGSVFTNMLEEVLQRVKNKPLEKKLIHQIAVDI